MVKGIAVVALLALLLATASGRRVDIRHLQEQHMQTRHKDMLDGLGENQSMAAMFFAMHDSNGDGQLDPRELEAIYDEMEQGGHGEEAEVRAVLAKAG